MGYALAMGHCICCDQVFSFNPMRVPSTKAFTGEREPVCRGCMERVNALREERGQEPFLILPDAYEPCDENELGD